MKVLISKQYHLSLLIKNQVISLMITYDLHSFSFIQRYFKKIAEQIVILSFHEYVDRYLTDKIKKDTYIFASRGMKCVYFVDAQHFRKLCPGKLYMGVKYGADRSRRNIVPSSNRCKCLIEIFRFAQHIHNRRSRNLHGAEHKRIVFIIGSGTNGTDKGPVHNGEG